MDFPNPESLYTRKQDYETMCLVYDLLSDTERSLVDFLRLVRQFLIDTNNVQVALDCVDIERIFVAARMKDNYRHSCLSLLEHLFAEQGKFCFDDIEKQEIQRALLSIR